MSNRGAAADWIATASPALVAFLRRLTHHANVKWEIPDYVDGGMTDEDGKPTAVDGRSVLENDFEGAEAISSHVRTGVFGRSMASLDELFGHRTHALLLDVDQPAWLIPSSTEGHSHLIVDLSGMSGVVEDDLWDFLDAAVKIGLVEEGYARASKSRGMTSLRAPWIRKGEEHADERAAQVEGPF